MAGVNTYGTIREFVAGEALIDLINRIGTQLPQVCDHHQPGPIQTCDTCMVEVDGKLARACATELVCLLMKIPLESATR